MTEPLPDWAVSEFAEFHASTVHKMIARARVLTDRHSAQDLVQDAYVLAARRWVSTLRNLDTGRRLRWMRTCIARLASDRRRSDRQFQDKAGRLYEPDVSRAPDPEDAALASVSAEACWRAIREMSMTTRIICVLVWVDGYSAAEVAGILGMSDSAVRGAIKRARDTLLRKKLGGGAA